MGSYEVCIFKNQRQNITKASGFGTIAYSNIQGRYFYKIGEIKRMLEERLVRSNADCLNDLITNHKLHVEEEEILERTSNGLNVFKHYTCQ